MIDELFFWKYKKKSIKQPVFIISNPRSGTTFLHNLLALDEERFTYMKFADTLFCSVSFVRTYKLLNRIHHCIGSPLSSVVRFVENKLFGGWKNIHPMRFNQPEEDEAIFAQMMLSPGIFILFPFADRVPASYFLDLQDAHLQEKAMNFYEDCVKRFLYGVGSENKTYLAKNVCSSGRVATLLSRFRDLKIIHIYRNPAEAVTSMASMFSSMYPLHSPSLAKTDPAYRIWCELSMNYYVHLFNMKKKFEPAQYVQISYDELIKDPLSSVEMIYNYFNWNFSHHLKNKISTYVKQSRNYKSKHFYKPEDFGFTGQEISSTINNRLNN
ncbi:MAG: sulfotransferase [Chitinophagales bacterium]|nr:sulfotransferase [Chitinophagales bacterium]